MKAWYAAERYISSLSDCFPLLANFLPYSYGNEFLNQLIKGGKGKLARKFGHSYRYIDDFISFNNKRFMEFISDIYPKELTISETKDSTSVAFYLHLLFYPIRPGLFSRSPGPGGKGGGGSEVRMPKIKVDINRLK